MFINYWIEKCTVKHWKSTYPWRHFVKSFYIQFHENLKNTLVPYAVSRGDTQSLTPYTAFTLPSLKTPNNTGQWPDSFPIAHFYVRLHSALIHCWQSSSNKASFSRVAVTSQPPPPGRCVITDGAEQMALLHEYHGGVNTGALSLVWQFCNRFRVSYQNVTGCRMKEVELDEFVCFIVCNLHCCQLLFSV